LRARHLAELVVSLLEHAHKAHACTDPDVYLRRLGLGVATGDALEDR